LIKATGYHRRLADCQELGRCLTKSSKTWLPARRSFSSLQRSAL
jgi:hypothetical protein